MLIRATISRAFAGLLDRRRVPGSYYFRSPHQNRDQVSLCLFKTGKIENQAVFCPRPHRKVQRQTDSSKVYVLRPPSASPELAEEWRGCFAPVKPLGGSCGPSPPSEGKYRAPHGFTSGVGPGGWVCGGHRSNDSEAIRPGGKCNDP